MAGDTENTGHSARYELVKHYYDRGLWPEARVRKAVECKWVTSDEFSEITGRDYKPATE